MPNQPYDIKVYEVSQDLFDPTLFSHLPALPSRSDETLDYSDLSLDPPVKLAQREESLWRRTEVHDRSAHLFLLAALLKRYGLRDDLIIQAIAHHPLSIDKYIGRTMKEAERIVQKLHDMPDIIEGEVIEQMASWDWLDFMTKPTHLDWLVQDSWVSSSVGFISGRAKSYKSWLALDLAMSVCTGAPFIDRFKTRRIGPVLIIQEEDPHAVIQERLRLIAEHKGIKFRGVMGSSMGLFSLPKIDLSIINLQGFKIEERHKVDQVQRLIRVQKPALVILDPFINIISPDTDEYRGSEIATALQNFKMWREELGCAVLIVHHWNKAGNADRGGENMYASFAFHAWMESALHVKPKVTEDEEITEVEVEREFKAGMASGSVFRLKFDIQTSRPGASHYAPVFGERKLSKREEIIEAIRNNPESDAHEIAQTLGYRQQEVTAILNELLKSKRISARQDGKEIVFSAGGIA